MVSDPRPRQAAHHQQQPPVLRAARRSIANVGIGHAGEDPLETLMINNPQSSELGAGTDEAAAAAAAAGGAASATPVRSQAASMQQPPHVPRATQLRLCELLKAVSYQRQ